MEVVSIDNTLVRLLVLDNHPRTSQQLENALWIWPHRIAVARDGEEAINMCQHLEPAALIVALDFPSDHAAGIVGALRDELPKTVIIAIGTTVDTANPGRVLELGANAVLTREELQRPTLHDLLIRLRPQPPDDLEKVVLAEIAMGLPWRDSQIVGALICDIRGTITTANECLSGWLDYPGAAALCGKNVWQDILNCRGDWVSWKSVAGDMTALLHQSVTVKARNEQLLWMNVEVFAAPDSPTHIQAIFADQSEIAHLTGRAPD
jgi:CheY-like chemotaxis protein